MKSLQQLTFSGLAIVLLLSSCTIEKRVYMSGYHIEWLNGKHNSDKNKFANDYHSKKTEGNKTLTVEKSETAYSSVNNSFNQSVNNNKITVSLDNNYIITPSNKPVSFIRTITTVNEKPDTQTKTEIKQETKKSKDNKSNNTDSGGKSQLVALLLCILVGTLGIHRFYLGYIGIGIIQLLTLGCCGIWTLIDLILIITGDLKPKGGDYEKKL